MHTTNERQSPEDSGAADYLDGRVNRRTLLKQAGVGAGALALPSVLAACGGSRASSSTSIAPSEAPKRGGTLVFAVDDMVGNFDPGVYNTYADWMALNVAGAALTFCDYKSTAVKPALAESWDVTRGGSRYTFHLRTGLTFHDGTPLTAHDFERSWTRLFNPNDPTQAPGSFTSFALLGQPYTKSFKAIDDHTFQVDLVGPDASFPARCSTIAATVLSAASIGRYKKDVGKHIISAGPFKFVSFTAGQNARFERFDGFYGGAPYLNAVIMQIIRDPTALVNALTTGAVQASDFVPLTSLPALRQSLIVHTGKPYVSHLAFMNASAPALADLRVRKAINYCLDRHTLIQEGFSGQGIQPGYLVPAADLGYDPSLEVYSTQNLSMAKTLINEAGAKGRTIRVIAANNRWWPTVGQIVQRNLQAIGLIPSVQYVDQLAFTSMETSLKQHEIALDSYDAIIPDPDDAARSILDPTGSYSTAITALNTVSGAGRNTPLLIQARQESDPTKRGQLYVELQRLSAETQMVVAMLAYVPAPTVSAKNVANLNADALGTYTFYPQTVSVA